MKKLTTKNWFLIMVIFAFASVISFFQINSYWADTHNFNGLIGWLGIGIVTGLVAIGALTQVAKAGSSNDSGSN